MPTSAAPVIEYLRQLEARGVTHVNVDDEARLILREFYMRARKQGGSITASRASTPAPTTSSATAAPSAPQVAKKGTERPLPAGNTAAKKLASLKSQVLQWPAIKQLQSLRKTMVFSVGNPSADIMLIGEAPGFDEERLGEPFVGKAGQKLNGILKAMGLEREQVYITNLVKFRPSIPNQTTNNRKPTPEEVAACLPFVSEEVKIVAPKVIIALGSTAAQGLLGKKASVASLRGSFHDYQGVPLRVTYHPSYILHNEATSEKRKLWEDMLSVMEYMGMPISEKQRGYFAS